MQEVTRQLEYTVLHIRTREQPYFNTRLSFSQATPVRYVERIASAILADGHTVTIERTDVRQYRLRQEDEAAQLLMQTYSNRIVLT